MIAFLPWQMLLDAIGSLLAWIYDVVPNYGLAIIILTVVIKLLLLPLGIKQIKSMQHMQAIQPKLKELQKKHKGNKQKIQEEQMRLYKEAGVNPLGGCLPLLLQFPILIAMYSVIKPISLEPVTSGDDQGAYVVVNNHLPEDSELFRVILVHGDTDFLWMNLQCSLTQSGSEVALKVTDPQSGESVDIVPGQPILGEDGQPIPNAESVANLDCGSSRIPDSIPYALLLLLMVGSTFFQQVQMQKASPPGSQTSQQQAIMRVMPLMFAFFGLTFPAGLVLYWTTSNIFQIGQQWFLLRAGHIGPDALEKRLEEQRARAATQGGQPQKETLMQRLISKVDEAQEQRDQAKGSAGKQGGPQSAKPKPTPKPTPKPSPKPAPGKKPPAQKGPAPGNQLKRKPKDGGTP